MSTAPRVGRTAPILFTVVLQCVYDGKHLDMLVFFQDIAKGICLAAYWKSLQLKTQTPFTLSVPRHELGGCYQGGKPDDITVG